MPNTDNRSLGERLAKMVSVGEYLGEQLFISGRILDTGALDLRGGLPADKFWARTTQDERVAYVINGSVSITNFYFYAKRDPGDTWTFRRPAYQITSVTTGGYSDSATLPPIIGDLSPLIDIQGYQFSPLRVSFDTSGGLSVLVNKGYHSGGLYDGGTIDLTASVPGTTGQARWVVVGIDTTTNALTAINGTPITGTQQDLVIADIADIAIPTGVMPLGAVALENGQTAITQGTSWIVDIRRHHDLGSGGFYETIEDNGTPETQRGILNFADNATGAIDFTATDDGANDRTTITAELDIEGLAEDSTPASTAFVVISDGGVLAKTALADLPSSGNIGVTDGTTTVVPTTDIDFDGAFFEVTNGGSGLAQVTLTSSGSAGSKQRFLPTVLYDNTLSAAGSWTVANGDLIAGVGDFADYEYLEFNVYSLKSAAAVSADAVYLRVGTGGTLDTTVGDYRFQVIGGDNASAVAAHGDTPAIGNIPGSSSGLSNSFTDLYIRLDDPASARWKTAWSVSYRRSAASTSANRVFGWDWEGTSTIDIISITTDNPGTDLFVAGGRLQILGYKRELIGGLETSSANVSNPPTDAELDAALGTPASVGNGFAALLDDNGADTNVYLVASNGTSWFYTALTKAT